MLLAEIPELKKRLQCWEYSLTLEERLQDIGPPIISIQRSCREIAKSPSLKVVLGMVLAMGNYLNGGHNKRGQADGFQIDALAKVQEIRDVHNKQSLAEYMVVMMKVSGMQCILDSRVVCLIESRRICIPSCCGSPTRSLPPRLPPRST